jgi:glycosyltransferase involved in cell wall biosynthesis
MFTVMNVAFPFARVGPDAVGGAEQILSHLDAALVSAGHHSIVVACGGETRGLLVETDVDVGRMSGSLVIDDEVRASVWQRCRETIENLLERWPVDLVHLHGIDFYEYLPSNSVPVLVTLHLPPSWYPSHAFRVSRPQTFLHCVSDSQKQACPPCPQLLESIPNGVPVSELGSSCQARRSFALALGRICPEKGFDAALDAARLADVPLFLAGEVFPYREHREYFQREIEPRLDSGRRFLGPVKFAQKRRLLNAARCVLVPSRARETSSLVAMEALACGTPVIAFGVGALPEIVEHGRTGFIVEDVEQMAEAIPEAAALNREHCRQAARQRFSLERMTARYLSVYEELIRSSSSTPARQERPTEEAALCVG